MYFLLVYVFFPVGNFQGRATLFSGHATVNQVRGNTIVWNQLVSWDSTTVTRAGVTCTITADDGKIVMDGTYDGTINWTFVNSKPFNMINGHVYYAHLYGKTSDLEDRWCIRKRNNWDTQIYQWNNKITFTYDTGEYVISPALSQSTAPMTYDNKTLYFTIYDLTQMFGSTIANSITTAQFNAMFPSPYYTKNEGQLISCGPTSVVSTGFNLWDEEWEVGTSQFSSKNYIGVKPNTQYYICCSRGAGHGYPDVYFYNENKVKVGATLYATGVATNGYQSFTTPSDCYYLKFGGWSLSLYGSNTYNHDICINISSSMNGTYKSYQEPEVMDLSWISELTYNDGTQDVQMFPNGLCSAGTVYDEITPTKAIKRVGSVDLGSVTWNRNADYIYYATNIRTGATSGFNYDIATTEPWDISGRSYATEYEAQAVCFHSHILWVSDNRYESASAFISAMQTRHPILYYSLVTPIEIPLNKSMGYAVQPGGTEQLLPENQPGATPTTSQIIIDVTYPLDSVGTLQNLKRNYMSEATLTSLITALNAINTNMSWKASRASDGSLIIAAN